MTATNQVGDAYVQYLSLRGLAQTHATTSPVAKDSQDIVMAATVATDAVVPLMALGQPSDEPMLKFLELKCVERLKAVTTLERYRAFINDLASVETASQQSWRQKANGAIARADGLRSWA